MGLDVAGFYDFEEGLLVLLRFAHGRVRDLQVVVHGLHKQVGLRLGVQKVDVAVVLERRFVRRVALLRLRQNVLNQVHLLGHVRLPQSGLFLGPRLPIQLRIVQGRIQRVNGAVNPVLVLDLLLEQEVADHRELEETHGLVVVEVLVVQSEEAEQIGDLDGQRRLVEHALRHLLSDLHKGVNLVDYVGLALQVVTRSEGVQHLRSHQLFVHLVAEPAQKVIARRGLLTPSAGLHRFLGCVRSRRLSLDEQIALIVVTKYIKLTLERRQFLLPHGTFRRHVILCGDVSQGDVIVEIQATIYHRISIFHTFVYIFEIQHMLSLFRRL